MKMLILWLACLSVACAQKPLGFLEAIRTTKLNSPTLNLLAFNPKIAEADLTTAGLRYNPEFNAQVLMLTDNRYLAENTLPVFSWKNRQDWVQLTQQVMIKNQRNLRIEAAKQQMALSQAEILEAQRNLIYQVASIWLEIWRIGVDLSELEENSAYVDSLVKINQIRLYNDVILPSEVSRTQILLQRYELEIISGRQQKENLSRTLAFLCGKDSIVINEADDFFDDIPDLSLDTLLNLLAKRSDLILAEQAKQTAQAQVSFQESLQYTQPTLGAILNPQNGVFYGGFFLTVPLMVNDKNQGNRQKAALTLQQAALRQNILSTQASIELLNAYKLFNLSKANTLRAQAIVAKSEEVLNTVRYSYLKSNTTIIDFLEAQRSNLENRRLLNQSLFLYRKSYIDLLFVSGLILNL